MNNKRKWLCNIRKEKNCSISYISEKVGITQTYYFYIEKGCRRPSPEVAKKIGDLLDFDWTRFYEEEKEE